LIILDQRPSIYTKKTREQYIDRGVILLYLMIEWKVHKRIAADLKCTSDKIIAEIEEAVDSGYLDKNWDDYVPEIIGVTRI